MGLDVALLLISLGVILVSAGFFTNGVEWLGRKLRLTEGAVGSILAAVGTAMPETVIPLIAILLGGGEVGKEIGIGAILGAPFMLGTLALLISGGAVLAFRRNRAGNYPRLEPDPHVIRRDLFFFLVVYTLAIAAAFLPRPLKLVVALGLVVAYIYFVYETITRGRTLDQEEGECEPLYLCKRVDNPPLVLVIVQVLLAFLGIVGGAKVFVDGVADLSALLGVPAFVFSLLVAPLATEMPEKFNSVIWLAQRKDTMALGNITGAMVFQSSVIPAIGIILTPWVLTETAFLSALLALASGLVTYLLLLRRGFLDARFLVVYGGVFYAAFVAAVLTGTIG
ncbi:sodium:calcium antiporter [Desulfofundulus thermosubterraneus]|uniref:Cation:H+ antiporter n=1 Tax=Desulfofundulus thermosubterraneus DSM 16057 TaxID=1121432 RepID=A0A1M6FK31_9FIRM|nr:sodium:calcium antiporter [Desulfofundulus thermosubterraneus]SHI98078.1 cation:H+ antiporter [Desulfofundulus thermosubterraneus DSM 16057]